MVLVRDVPVERHSPRIEFAGDPADTLTARSPSASATAMAVRTISARGEWEGLAPAPVVAWDGPLAGRCRSEGWPQVIKVRFGTCCWITTIAYISYRVRFSTMY